VVTAILEEQEGYTQLAIQKYGRALDTIDWVNASLGAGPDRKLYGRGDAKQRVEVVYEGVFARGVQCVSLLFVVFFADFPSESDLVIHSLL